MSIQPPAPTGAGNPRRAAATITPCPSCGGAVGCAMGAPEGCWCARLPLLATIDPEVSACLCAPCLAHLLEQQRASTGQPA